MATISLLKELPFGEAYEKAKTMAPESIVEEIKKSDLRGRGGAGFLTGLKWDMTKLYSGESVVVCNADEGELGTFKDRKLLTEQPKQVLEGMAICARAVKAKTAIIYLRWEYSYMVDDLQAVIDRTKSVFKGINFEIRMGAGAYVCGEETALLDSLEGRRGEPRNKPPFPVEKGYLDKPTIINNVETFCCVAQVVHYGAEAFKAIGITDNTGPKLFSVSGDVSAPGVYEFPMGTTLRSVLKKAGAKDPKAVLVGGGGGIIVGKKEFGRKLAFGDLPPGGSIIVLGQKRNMLKVLEKIMEFFLEESCGQCVPCREGCYRLYRLVRRLIEEGGTISKAELNTYRDLSETMQTASKCGLGQSAPNTFLSVVDSFQKECMTITK